MFNKETPASLVFVQVHGFKTTLLVCINQKTAENTTDLLSNYGLIFLSFLLVAYQPRNKFSQRPSDDPKSNYILNDCLPNVALPP